MEGHNNIDFKVKIFFLSCDIGLTFFNCFQRITLRHVYKLAISVILTGPYSFSA